MDICPFCKKKYDVEYEKKKHKCSECGAKLSISNEKSIKEADKPPRKIYKKVTVSTSKKEIDKMTNQKKMKKKL